MDTAVAECGRSGDGKHQRWAPYTRRTTDDRDEAEALWRAGQRLNDVVTWISEWIDLAYTPEREGRGSDLAEYLDRNERA